MNEIPRGERTPEGHINAALLRAENTLSSMRAWHDSEGKSGITSNEGKRIIDKALQVAEENKSGIVEIDQERLKFRINSIKGRLERILGESVESTFDTTAVPE